MTDLSAEYKALAEYSKIKLAPYIVQPTVRHGSPFDCRTNHTRPGMASSRAAPIAMRPTARDKGGNPLSTADLMKKNGCSRPSPPISFWCST